MAAVSGILAGLIEREKTGRGRKLEISIAQTMHSWLAIPLSHLAATGREPGRQWWNGAHPFYSLYATKDGEKLAVAGIESGFALSLLDLLGLAKLRPLAENPLKNAVALSAALKRAFRSATLAQWKERLSGKDVCVTPVYGLAEASARLRTSVRPARKETP